MITRPTVLILGAGASMPYKYPSGKQLRDDISMLINNLNEKDFTRTFGEWGFERKHVKEFGKALWYCPLDSVDAFLENRSEFSDVGKAAIAYMLIKHEREDNLFDADITKNIHDDWYPYLFKCMQSPLDQFKNNRLAILTYNYDRSLQHFLIKSLSATYKLDDSDIKEILSSIRIIHLHGSLGKLLPNDSLARPYKPEISKKNIELAVKEIKIIHEEEAEKEYREAYDLLDKAERIGFLGFGYNEINLSRLFKGNWWKKEKKWIGGTSVGLTQMEVRKFLQIYDVRMNIDSTGNTILPFLRKTGFLIGEVSPFVEHPVEKNLPIQYSVSRM